MTRLRCWLKWHRWYMVSISGYATFYRCRHCGTDGVDALGYVPASEVRRWREQLANDMEEGR